MIGLTEIIDDEIKFPLRKYGPPRGVLYIAKWNSEVAGCIALAPLVERGACEMKRLYVRPHYRKHKIGKVLVEQLLKDAVQLGYTKMKLDTLEKLQPAIGLYKQYGFVETTNYAFNYFAKQTHGQIVGISSIASFRGNSWAPAYSASKAFMSNYLEGIRIKAERMKKAIYVTDIQPGYIQTEMLLGNKLFWIASLDKASLQIFTAIEQKKQRVQVTKRWALVAWLLKWVPYSFYKKIG